MAANPEHMPTGFSTMTSAIEFADNYTKWIIGTFSPFFGSRLLEIGTGQGNFTRLLRLHVAQITSIDIDADVIARAKQRDPGGDYRIADVSSSLSFSTVLSPQQFESVLCVNVLEHIKNDSVAIDNMLQVLAKGGYLLLFVPALPVLFNSMDTLAGHLRRYTARSIRLLLADKSLQFGRISYFNPIGGLGWWVNGLTTHRNLDSTGLNAQVRAFDRFVLPVSRFLDPLTQSFFGQSLVCICQKVTQ